MRSDRCQSGPCSSTTTFLPACAITAANTEPEAPAPTMTTSTFSFAMSPPPGRRDMRHVGNAEAGITVHGAVHDIDGIAAQQQINEWSGRTLPAFHLVLTHVVHEAALLRFTKLRKFTPAMQALAGAVDGAERCAIEIGIGRAHIENARLEQGLLRRYRDLLIDKVGNASLARAGHERLAERIEGCRLPGGQRAQRHPLRARSTRREQNLGTAHRECECAGCRAFQQGAPFNIVHGLLPGAFPRTAVPSR